MDFITTLAKLMKQFGSKANSEFLPKGKVSTLFQAILEQRVGTDREAAQYIYGKDARPEEKKFLMLKKELEEQLVDQLLKIHTRSSKPKNKLLPTAASQSTAMLHTKLWCRKQMMLSELLLNHHSAQHAEKILLKVSKQAEKMLFYHILEECWMLLRQVYMMKGDAKRDLYDEKIVSLQEEKRLINQAISKYEQLQSKSESSLARSYELAQEAEASATAVGQWLDKLHPFIQYYYYRICTVKCIHYLHLQELHELIRQQAAFIKLQPRFRNEEYLAEIYLNLIYLCKARGSLRSAKLYIRRLLTYQHLHGRLSLSVLEQAFDIYMKTQEYEEAGTVLETIRQTYDPLLSPVQKSQWLMKEAYLYYILLHQDKKEDIVRFTPTFATHVNLSAFDQQTAPLAYDKKGHQIQVLIIKSLLMHVIGEKDFSYHTKLLQVYYRRHLSDLEDLRTKLFFQVIIRVSSVNFSSKKMKNQPLIEELESLPNIYHERQEIIPYKTLWKMAEGRMVDDQ